MSTMHGWNFADVFETIAATIPNAPALTNGDVRRSWSDFDERAEGVARTLLAAGLAHQDKVALYLRNSNEYLETFFALCKAGLVHVNTNYRYVRSELKYLWLNADAAAVVFHGSFTEQVAELRDEMPGVRAWIWVDDRSAECPPWAIPYSEAAAAGTGPAAPPSWSRSGDDLLLLYTGGTTGLPKGVMWRQDDLYGVFNAGRITDPDAPDLDAVRRRLTRPGPVQCPLCPLMHGTGLLAALQTLRLGGSVVTRSDASFDIRAILDTLDRERVNAIAIVGDAFGKPLVGALEAEPLRWNLERLRFVVSSGVMLSGDTKRRLLALVPGITIQDSLGSSEALGIASSVTSAEKSPTTASFQLSENAIVISDEGHVIRPGSDVVGRLAVRGRTPIGYYKDPVKTAATFPVIDGIRYSVPGDYAAVARDGSIRLLGRGSQCINTAGEKVFPEEVEEVLKTHPTTMDAIVVGLPNDRFGEVVVALVEPKPGSAFDPGDLIAHVRVHLAPYKAPRHVLTVPAVTRADNGKVDYPGMRAIAAQLLGVEIAT